MKLNNILKRNAQIMIRYNSNNFFQPCKVIRMTALKDIDICKKINF